MQFPNYFFNSMIYRDERTINITRIGTQKLIVNRSESAMMELPESSKLNGKTFKVKLSHHNIQDRSILDLVTFNVTFLDRYNTDIFRSPLIKDGNLPIFYSCGDKNF